MQKVVKHSAFLIILALLVFPAVQNLTGIVNEPGLEGDFTTPEKPESDWPSWFSGELQAKADPYIEQHIGFHNTLVRLTNQIDLMLFRKANAEGVVIGKGNVFFEKDYIRAYLGDDFMGERYLDEKLRRLKFLQDHLFEQFNIRLTLVFEPSKVRMMPEYLPRPYAGEDKEISIYEYCVEQARSLNIDFIDFNSYYREIEPHADYPLYPPYGIHWSLYGMTYCADSLLSWIGHHYPSRLRSYNYSFEVDSEPRRTDNDVEKTMNLLFPLPSPELAYPIYSFAEEQPVAKPNVLVVGDSYYWNIYNTGIPAKLFSEANFWYFNALVYPDNYTGPKRVTELDIRGETEERDFIFLMVTERFLYKFDWQYLDMLFEEYASDVMRYPEYLKINKIVQNSGWFDSIIEQSVIRNRELEELLWEDAWYQYMTQDHPDFLIRYGVERQAQIIREDEGWYGYIKNKASEKNVSVEKALYDDADYVFASDHPELHGLYHAIDEIEQQIGKNPEYLAIADSISTVYHQPVDRFRHRLARYIYKMERIREIRNAILGDKSWFDHVREKAEEKGISIEEMTRIDAKFVFDKEIEALEDEYGSNIDI
jgi:hypothetical protein